MLSLTKKIKLGSPEGIDRDKEILERILHFTKNECNNLRVDANDNIGV